jgi:5-(carboxyamino)imidazole ribonucleotide mutase
MRAAAETLKEFGVAHEVRVLSAHRTPDAAMQYARAADGRGLRVVIAGAGGAAHLAGVLAASTPLPVVGVPIQSPALQGLDSLLSIVQMPAGVPVATVAIGGAKNAALLSVQILATADAGLRAKMIAYKESLARAVEAKDAKLSAEASPSRMV